jgi:beta-galactosidase
LIRRRVLSANRTVLWCYAPGYFNGASRSAEAMRELTGLRIVTSADAPRVRARMELRRGSHPIADEFLRSGSGPIGGEHVWAQAATVEDPTATALGVRQGTQEVALALKAMGSWTSIYTLNPVLPAAFLRSIARHAGVHIYNDRDDTLYASRGYLTINADGAGTRAIRFPCPVHVWDPFAGRQLARNTTRFTCELRDKETLLLSLDRP